MKARGIKGVPSVGAPVRHQKAVSRSKEKRRSGAPRGERPTSLGVRRKASRCYPRLSALRSLTLREGRSPLVGEGIEMTAYPAPRRTGAAELCLFTRRLFEIPVNLTFEFAALVDDPALAPPPRLRGGWPSGGDSRARSVGSELHRIRPPPPGRSLRERPPSPKTGRDCRGTAGQKAIAGKRYRRAATGCRSGSTAVKPSATSSSQNSRASSRAASAA